MICEETFQNERSPHDALVYKVRIDYSHQFNKVEVETTDVVDGLHCEDGWVFFLEVELAEQ
eukprot:CAMPEP_0116945338 /NCGR_PEP_ID=MMETSP0467-20121206/36305_1 /TAXON_ID=283647 /ORGANISM="Mesodinium pulex, Strain SPMC105" /LENGTH=60 /DNA_ID=CAMNT_0004628855 /DNA_START=525 /DNA_END=704 /DNA_ORIENTATION=-